MWKGGAPRLGSVLFPSFQERTTQMATDLLHWVSRMSVGAPLTKAICCALRNPPPMAVRVWESYHEKPSCTSAQLWRSPPAASIVRRKPNVFCNAHKRISPKSASFLGPYHLHLPALGLCLESPVLYSLPIISSSRSGLADSTARLVRKTGIFDTGSCRRILAPDARMSPTTFP